MKLLAVLAGLASMRAALERGDLDEAARQGMLAGPAIVERALASRDRGTQLAGIVAAPAVDDRAELLPALAAIAGGPDRRTAIPAGRAARAIARELGRAAIAHDDLAADDLATWRTAWGAIGLRPDRWIELRVLALETAAALAAPRTVGFELAAALTDRDPALRTAAVALVPQPAPVAARAPLAKAVVDDADDRVALGAAQALCADLVADAPAAILAVLGAPGLARIRTLVATNLPIAAIRDAARCLAADPAPASASALRKLAPRLPRDAARRRERDAARESTGRR